MIGELLVSHCERVTTGVVRCLEVWAFPDRTLNLVVSEVSGSGEKEFCFPCGLPHLLATLRGRRPLRCETDSATLSIERETDALNVAMVREGEPEWHHRVPIETFEMALLSRGYLV